MYSKIIQLTTRRLKKNEHLTAFDLTEDLCLKAHSDYAGSEYVIGDVIDSIASELQPVAFVNKNRRTITFKKEKTLEDRILRNQIAVHRDTKRGFRGNAVTTLGAAGYRSHKAVLKGIETVGVTDILFHYGENGANDETASCHTLSEMLFDYLNGYLPRTLKIETVLDYHY